MTRRPIPLVPLVVGVTSSKGGAGRTSAAVHLGVALARIGLSVEVWDATAGQDSCAHLAPERVRQGLALTVRRGPHMQDSAHPFNPAEMPTVHAQTDVVLIDTSAGMHGVRTALRYPLDLALVPSQPSPLDMYGTWATLDALPAMLPRVVLPFRVLPTDLAGLLPEMREALAEHAVPVLHAVVHERGDCGEDPRPERADDWDAVAAELLREHLTLPEQHATVSVRVPARLQRRYKLAALETGQSLAELASAALTGHMRALGDDRL